MFVSGMFGFVMCDVLVGVDGIYLIFCVQFVLVVVLVRIGVLCVYGRIWLLIDDFVFFEVVGLCVVIMVIVVDGCVVVFEDMWFCIDLLVFVVYVLLCSWFMLLDDYFYWVVIGLLSCFGLDDVDLMVVFVV